MNTHRQVGKTIANRVTSRKKRASKCCRCVGISTKAAGNLESVVGALRRNAGCDGRAKSFDRVESHAFGGWLEAHDFVGKVWALVENRVGAGGTIAFGVSGEHVVLIITGNAGGANDFIARLVAQGLSASLGQAAVVINRAGSQFGSCSVPSKFGTQSTVPWPSSPSSTSAIGVSLDSV